MQTPALKAKKAVWSVPKPVPAAPPTLSNAARHRALNPAARPAPLNRSKPVEWLATPPDCDFDLRRGRDSAIADRVIARAGWLPPPERALVLAVYRDGMSVSALARVQKCDPRLLRRRLARCVARLLDARAQFVATHACDWTPLMAGVGRSIYLHGLTMRETARRASFTLHIVRDQRLAIDAMFDVWRERGCPPASGTPIRAPRPPAHDRPRP